MSINATKLVESIMRRNGLFTLALPFKMQDVCDELEITTLPQFSYFYPNMREVNVSLKDLKPIPKSHQTMGYREFILPEALFGDEYYYIRKIHKLPTHMQLATMSGFAHTKIDDVRFKFIQPNKVRIHSAKDTDFYRFEVAVPWRTVAEVPTNFYDVFYRLANADIKIFCYENLRHYSKLSSPFGEISLDLDGLSTGKDERDTVLADLRENFSLDYGIDEDLDFVDQSVFLDLNSY